MEQYRAAQSPEIAAMVRRGQQLLGDRDWDRALAMFDRILEQSPECAEAHAGLMLAKAKMRSFAEMGQILPTLFREEKLQWGPARQPDTARIEAAAERGRRRGS